MEGNKCHNLMSRCNYSPTSILLFTEVQMYLIILELMEKWEDALQLIEGPLGGNFGVEMKQEKLLIILVYRPL